VSRGERAEIFRRANECIRDAAATYGMRDRVPFVCECADVTCTEIVRLSLDEYAELGSRPAGSIRASGHFEDGRLGGS
jgi:hypothetical protein